MRFLKKTAIAFVAFLLLAQTTAGVEQRPIKSIESGLFRPVAMPSILDTIKDFEATNTPKPSKPPIIIPVNTPKTVDLATLKPKLTVNTLTGVASYYCNADSSRGPISRCHYKYPDGSNSYYAAIRKDLLNTLRGKTIQVCEGSKCLNVKIIDCNCGANANLIDLYGDAFRYFHPLTKGKFKVTIKW